MTGRPRTCYQDRVLEVLTAAAKAGAPCPSNQDLADRTGHGHCAHAGRVLLRLAAEGVIGIEQVPNARRVTIVETGARTGWTGRRDVVEDGAGITMYRRILMILADAAGRRAPCPTNDQIADRLGVSCPKSIATQISTLGRNGLIAVERSSARRRITVVDTGARTDWTLPRAPESHLNGGAEPRIKGQTRNREPVPVPVPEHQRAPYDAPCARCSVRYTRHDAHGCARFSERLGVAL